jgi:hypothetical protein
MTGADKDNDPLGELVEKVMGWKAREDLLSTDEEMKDLRRSLEKATEKAFQEFDRMQLRALEASSKRFVRRCCATG